MTAVLVRRPLSTISLDGHRRTGFSTASTTTSRKRTSAALDSDDTPEMQSYLAAPSANAHYLAPPPSSSSGRRIPALRIGEDIDDFLSSDLEHSFASNMSLQSPDKSGLSVADSDAMEISPMPMRTYKSENVDLEAAARKATLNSNRPRANTVNLGVQRLFGRDASNDDMSTMSGASNGTKSSGKRTQRAALPFEWMSQARAPSPVAPASDDAMDIDSSYSQSISVEVDAPYVDLSSPEPVPLSAAPTITGFDAFSPAPLSAAPTIKGFDAFFDAVSPERSRDDIAAHPAKKRRSISPPRAGRRRSGTIGNPLTLDSSPLAASPSALKLERILSGGPSSGAARLPKPMLSGLGAPDAAANPNKRARRPVVSSMIAPPAEIALRSANPTLGGADGSSGFRPMPATRRAFSAMLPPGGQFALNALNADGSASADESSFDRSGDMSSPAAAHVKRQQDRTLRRRDGTDNFRAESSSGLRHSAEIKRESQSPRSRAMPEWGLGSFGDNEAAGKVLPCHRVREDGLMRIKPSALDDLLDGKYSSQIEGFQVIDCRFDYEYAGGHIPGAININTTQALEEYFLGNKVPKPSPSTSGVGPRKRILVFHCEFSVKRAPTFAKHLRSKDRAMNSMNYPSVYYPEVYVLEGGYCNFFKESRARMRPTGYVRMDDPVHAVSRKEDLDQFRKGKFGRTRSYAYGDMPGAGSKSSSSSSSTAAKRASAPTQSAQVLFGAATKRRSALEALAEDHPPTDEETDTDIGDSPCPPPTRSAAFKGKRMSALTRAPALLRAETYDPSRFAY